MILADQVVTLLMVASPSFAEQWSQELENDPIHLNDDGTRLNYLDAGAFARHLLHLYKAREFSEIDAAFEVFEQLHVDGDPYVRELATIGYLEGIQFVTSHDADVSQDDFERFLRPESRRWWNGLNRFWAGEEPTVRPID